jgi:phage terminase large subunit GpA-like protein
VPEPTELVRTAFAAGLKPDPILSVSDWASEHRRLSRKASAEPGTWRNERTPYLVEIMDCLSPRHLAREVIFMKGAQVGGTEAGNNWIGYVIDQAPGPMLAILPTVDMARRSSRQRIEPLIEESPTLRAKVGDRKSREASNTIFSKDFPGGTLVLTGANSPTGLRSMPARYLFFDEVDAYPGDVGGEGDPVNLAKRRASTFARRKILMVSTPTIEGRSRIADAFEESDQRFYEVPCPDCQAYQRLDWKRMQWDEGQPHTVAMACEACGVLITEQHKGPMLAAGRWVAANPSSDIRGYHLSALYSPPGWYSWTDAVADFLKAKDDPEKLRVWINTVLGETWRERGDAPPWAALYRRRESYARGTVPEGGCVLTAGADVQGDRIEVEIVAWGPRHESWSVDYRVHSGDPSQPEVWRHLEELLAESFPSAAGGEMAVAKLAVDSGAETQSVYAWVASQPAARVMAVKGFDHLQVPVGQPTPVDINRAGRRVRRGTKLWPVGVSLIKGELYGWLRQEPPLRPEDQKPVGWAHFPEYDEQWFQMLTAEELVRRKVRGYTRFLWEKIRDRNEALDCRVYARAALWAIGAQRWKPERWELERLRVAPLPAPAPAAATPSVTTPELVPRARRARNRSQSDWLGGGGHGLD